VFGIPLLLRLVTLEMIAYEFGLVLGTSDIYPRGF